MELFHCISTPPLQEIRARSEEKDAKETGGGKGRRQSLPAPPLQARTATSSSTNLGPGWSKHYQQKKSVESLEKLTSRTLSPPPETLPRKFSRAQSLLPGHTCSAIRLPRHPELPPLTTEVSAPRLKDYLEKPRLVSTYGRRPSQVGMAEVDQLVPGLAKLSSYYNQTFLNVCDTCDSLNHRNPVSVLNSALINRGM